MDFSKRLFVGEKMVAEIYQNVTSAIFFRFGLFKYAYAMQ